MTLEDFAAEVPSPADMKAIAAAHKKITELQEKLAAERSRKSLKFAGAKTGLRRGLIRVTFGDTHGMRIDQQAAAALIADLKLIQPHEIIHGGDCLDCDGFLSTHRAIGYTSLSEYSYDEDIGAANDFLDAVQRVTPNSRCDLIEGNHEYRVRTWCKDNSQNDRDMAYHWKNNGPPSVLHLEKRGIAWYSRGERYDGLAKRGTIKRGKMLYVHGDSHAANAGQRHLQGSAANVTYFHTHRADVIFTSTEATGVIGAFNSGCLCERHPMWKHSEPSTWSQGYGLEFVRPDGDFLKFVVPIIDGKSLLEPLLKMLGV